ncbi:MAG: hypothetical protein M5U35_06525 [Roseovarius sp.]|nr:hypothetical protein [Roseovarius sp.]
MNTSNTQATAGLVFTSGRDLDIVEAANHAAGCIEALGHRVTGTHVLSDTRARVITDQIELVLWTEEDVSFAALPEPAGVFLSVRLALRGEARLTRFTRDSIIARTLQKLHELLAPDFVKWIGTDVLLPAADFARAVGLTPSRTAVQGPVRPRRVTSRSSLPDIEETNDTLQRRFSDQDPAIFSNATAPDRLRKVFTEDWIDPDLLAEQAAAEAQARDLEDIETTAPLRLSAWLISFAVALFALPIGVTLLILNLAKGENLRLASQTAALTGTFLALQSFGTMASAMTVLKGLVS